MNTMTICVLLISIYVAIESWIPICRMDGGLTDFCHKVKYAMAILCAVGYMAHAIGTYFGIPIIVPPIDWLVLASTGTMALFIWPRSVYRFQQWHKLYRQWRLKRRYTI
jgi:hypothetical protein